MTTIRSLKNLKNNLNLSRIVAKASVGQRCPSPLGVSKDEMVKGAAQNGQLIYACT